MATDVLHPKTNERHEQSKSFIELTVGLHQSSVAGAKSAKTYTHTHRANFKQMDTSYNNDIGHMYRIEVKNFMMKIIVTLLLYTSLGPRLRDHFFAP